MADLPKAAIIRLAKKAGVERIGGDAADALVAKTEAYVEQSAKKAYGFAQHAGRKTIKAEDIDLATKN
ncbi:MAG TPA: NFYB/HAP3 family transcription factor subunit [Methanocorpusculum sp.]|nr:NFYB/HAP3 family transcription factor subunit [Methanocorpusculum sp.]